MSDKLLGTLTYVPPELIQSFTNKTGNSFHKEADMWSLGVIVFAVLAGRHPFNHPNEHKLKMNILSCNYDFEPEDIWNGIS